MRVIESSWSIAGSHLTTYSLSISNFYGNTKRLELASKIKNTTTRISFSDSSLNDVIEFLYWYEHAIPEFVWSMGINKDLSPNISENELLNTSQNRLSKIFSLEFASCEVQSNNSRIRIEALRFFTNLETLKIFNCKLDGILSALMFDSLKSLTSLHTLSLISCGIESIEVAKLFDVIANNLQQLAVIEIKQNEEVTSLVERKVTQMLSSNDFAFKFCNLIGLSINFGERSAFNDAFISNIRDNLLVINKKRVDLLIHCIDDFLNEDELPLNEEFFKAFYSSKSSITHQMTSPSAGNKMLSPLHVKSILNQINDALWDRLFSKYLEREPDVYLNTDDIFEVLKDKLITGNTSLFNEILEDLVQISCNSDKTLTFLENLKEISVRLNRYFPTEYIKSAIKICQEKMEVDIAYS